MDGTLALSRLAELPTEYHLSSASKLHHVVQRSVLRSGLAREEACHCHAVPVENAQRQKSYPKLYYPSAKPLGALSCCREHGVKAEALVIWLHSSHPVIVPGGAARG